MPDEDEAVIAEQISYYSARAPEYDETASPVGHDILASQGDQLRQELVRFGPRGKVLEIACGTGSWTRLLARHADELTAIDPSAEMLDICREKLGDVGVRLIQADVFSWAPDDRYDVVFFANWLSHVPPRLFERFWDLVARCLAPDGQVFFLDEEAYAVWRREEFLDSERTLVRRRLRDGRTFDIVKVFYDAAELERRLQGLGWAVKVRSTGDMYWGRGRQAH
jgi:ubiquinone/menaquinone biosynthesis C-methylase UbiE